MGSTNSGCTVSSVSVTVIFSRGVDVRGSVSPSGTSSEIVVLNVNSSVDDVNIYTICVVEVAVVVISRENLADTAQSPRRSIYLNDALSSLLSFQVVGNTGFPILSDVFNARVRSDGLELSVSKFGRESFYDGLVCVLHCDSMDGLEVVYGSGSFVDRNIVIENNNVLSWERFFRFVQWCQSGSSCYKENNHGK